MRFASWDAAMRAARTSSRRHGVRYRVGRDDKYGMPRWRVRVATRAPESGPGHSGTVERVEAAERRSYATGGYVTGPWLGWLFREGEGQRLHGPGCSRCDAGVTEWHRAYNDLTAPQGIRVDAGQVERVQDPLGLSWSGSSTTAMEQGHRWRNA